MAKKIIFVSTSQVWVGASLCFGARDSKVFSLVRIVHSKEIRFFMSIPYIIRNDIPLKLFIFHPYISKKIITHLQSTLNFRTGHSMATNQNKTSEATTPLLYQDLISSCPCQLNSCKVGLMFTSIHLDFPEAAKILVGY